MTDWHGHDSLKYRVNFGNGQVHYAGNRLACVRYIDHDMRDDPYQRFAFVEWQDPETLDWFKQRRSA